MPRESSCAHLDREAEIVKACVQALRELGRVSAIEVVGAEVAIVDAVFEHVVGGREHRGGDGEDGFLRAPATLDPQELGPTVAVLFPGGCPRGLHERGLQPRITRPRPMREALAGALVEPGAKARRMARPLLPKTSARTAVRLILAFSRVFWMRRVCWAISRTSCLRVRVRSRSSWMGSGGTKLPRMRPWASQSAIHGASFTSLLRPGMLRMCLALARTSSKWPSSTCQTGFQYTPLDSMATCVQPWAVSQSLSASNSAVVVPKVRTS